MSWASRRRTTYLSGVLLFFVITIGVPLFFYFYKPASCFDGKQDNGETAVDKGGECNVLDERSLSPSSTSWARSFSVRGGFYNAVAYIENPNEAAGVISAPYRFRLYDENNVEIAEREGRAFIMPGTITPVFEGQIETGNRVVAHTFFEFTAPLVWRRTTDTAGIIKVSGRVITDTATMPRITAVAKNTSVSDVKNYTFVAVVFDISGNAMAASETALQRIQAGKEAELTFTWPDAFTRAVGHVDITALRIPVEVK